MPEKITKCEHDGYIEYRNEKGERHNINGDPAIIWEEGSKEWFRNGKSHRTRGPAEIYSNDDEYWWYKGNNITVKVNQLMADGHILSDWENWTEEDEFLFVLLVS